MRSNDIHVSHGSTYDDAYCESCNDLDTSDRFVKDIDVQVQEQPMQSKCIHYDMKTYYGEQRRLSNTVSLIDSTECCDIKRKDWECYMKATIRVPDHEVKLYHRSCLRCLGKSTCLKQEL